MKDFKKHLPIFAIVWLLIIWITIGVFWSNTKPKTDIERIQEELTQGMKNQEEEAKKPISIEVESQYPGCDKSDIKIWDQIWSSCNIGTNKAGTWVESYGKYIAFWSEKWFQEMSREELYNYQESKSNWKNKQGLCANGYSMPSAKDWNTLFDNLNCKSYLPKCLTKVLNTLVLPQAWTYEARRISKEQIANPSAYWWYGQPVFDSTHYEYWLFNDKLASNGSKGGSFFARIWEEGASYANQSSWSIYDVVDASMLITKSAPIRCIKNIE